MVSVDGFVDGGLHEVLEGVGVPEDGVAFGKTALLIEELLLGEVAHALPVDGQIAEPRHELVIGPCGGRGYLCRVFFV